MTSKTRYAIIAAAVLLIASAPASLGQATGSIRGKVKERDGKSLEGVSIKALRGGEQASETKSDSKGDFVLNGLPAGEYVLSFERAGYRSFTTRAVAVEAGETMRLRRAIELSPERGAYAIIRGAVFTSEGFSLANVRVRIERISEGKRLREETISHERGEFSFRLPAEKATYRVTATARGFEQAVKEIEIEADEVRQIALSLEREK